jgi:DNA replication protein DnaC
MNQKMKELLAGIGRKTELQSASRDAFYEAEIRKLSEKTAAAEREAEKRRLERERESLLEEWKRRGISPRYFGAEWGNWIAETEAQRRAFETVKRDAWRKNLLLLGKPGTGKTHLAMCLAKDGAVYRRASDLFREVRENFGAEGKIVAECGGCKLLILDEIGRQRGSLFERNLLFDIVDLRWANALPTTVIGNMDDEGEELTELLGWAVLDRLRAEKVRFDWGSRR